MNLYTNHTIMSKQSASFVPQFESRLWAESHKAGHPGVLNGGDNEIGIVKSINKDEFHAIIQTLKLIN